jgi:hypothetical protein
VITSALRSLCLPLVLTALACGARQVPPPRPAGSAAALDAPEAPRAKVARAVREDPPLPGAPLDGWEGLRPPDGAPAPAGHQHHHHHEDPQR